VRAGEPSAGAALSTWLGRTVELRPRPAGAQTSYEMTFDPPDDTAERFEIPSPEGTYFDLAALHLLTTSSLAACARVQPGGTWATRRFRPNVLAEVPGDDDFPEDAWVGRSVRVGDVMIDVLMRTVRCAMPLRAQPAAGGDGALERDIELYRTMNTTHENHLGVYASVRSPGSIALGDPIELV
jgi:MOSC domain-containing protein